MKNKLTLLMLLLGSLTFFSGCYYDNEEDLYVGTSPCDTTNLTFTNDISPIFSTNCNSCHSGAAAEGAIHTDDYNAVKDNITRIHGAINHLSNYRPMPDNGTKLPDCELSKINAWINNGMPQ